ncbi:MAG: nitroreductase family protein [Armatimonadota bacterium]
MNVRETIETRRSIPFFDPSVKIPKEEILRLCNLANLSPSSMNLQPWEFIVCTTPESKQKLREVSYNQPKITDASAMIILLGNLEHHLHAADVVESQIRNGYFGEERRESWIQSALGAYADNAQKQRDEAFRGGSLWAMTLMLAAHEAGWDSAPLGGFVPEQVSEVFSIPETHIPVLLIALGKRPEGANILPRNDRISAEELTHWETW